MDVNYGKIGTRFYLVGLILTAIFIPTSKYFLSLSQFYLLAVWMISGLPINEIHNMFPNKSFFKRLFSQIGVALYGIWNNIKNRFNIFLHNKIAIILVSLFIMHVIGLIYTSDFQYAVKDLRIKLPLIVFPVILSSMKPLNKKHFDIVLWFFIASVFFVSIFSAVKLFRHDFVDVRELSVFVSHIRFCLCMVFSIFIMAYFLVKRDYKLIVKVGILVLIAWFCWQIKIFESFISVLIIINLCLILLLYFIFKHKSVKFRIISTIVIIALLSLIIYRVYDIVRDCRTPEKVIVEQLDKTTKLGNPYIFDTIHFGVEDGRYVGLYLSKKEMIKAWNQRSDMNVKNSNNYYILVRYLTSKGLRKDAEGVEQLTEEDIDNIENKIANYNYINNPGIKTRISKLMVAYEKYKKKNDINESSVFQRLEYIKASLHIIRKHPVFGVGTGDIINAFKQFYEENNSNLKQENRNRSHNQYLSITIVFGIIGLIWFLITMLYPYFSDKKNRNFLYSVFLFIILFSMLSEDTIETQIGVTLYAFFNSFLIFSSPLVQEEERTT